MNIHSQRIVPAWKDEFYARFPHLFADVLTGTESVSPLTERGIECGIGWKKILEKLCIELEAMITTFPEAERGDFRVTQLKQKFGTLRCYMSKLTPVMIKKIDAAEIETMKVCELCGKPDHEDRPCPTKR